MGARANIRIKQQFTEQPEYVYLYAHWGGEEIALDLKRALSRSKDRWNDSPYLARVVFCEMVRKDIDGTSGFGISSQIGDNEYPVITVDCDSQNIHVTDHVIQFADYIKLPDIQLLTYMRETSDVS